jgi:hypothetical protein
LEFWLNKIVELVIRKEGSDWLSSFFVKSRQDFKVFCPFLITFVANLGGVCALPKIGRLKSPYQYEAKEEKFDRYTVCDSNNQYLARTAAVGCSGDGGAVGPEPIKPCA